MPLFAVISGYQGAGKTTLLNRLNSKFPSIITQDVDEFLEEPFNVGNFQQRIEQFIKDYESRIIILGGTFCNSAEEKAFIPDAPHKIWLNTDMMHSVCWALDRQLEDIDNGGNLYEFLMDKTPEEAKEWLDSYLNPHRRIIENKAQKRLCYDFTPMYGGEIEQLIQTQFNEKKNTK